MDGSFWRRSARAAADPWLLLVSCVGAGLAWATGSGVEVAAAVGVVMEGAGAAVKAAVSTPREPDWTPYQERKEVVADLVPGTPQARMVDLLKGYVADIRQLRESHPPDAVMDSAVEALVASETAYASARKVAGWIDKLDDALRRSESVAKGFGATPPTGVWDSIGRMKARRESLVGGLDAAIGQVAQAYTQLLELRATVDSVGQTGGTDGIADVAAVNTSLDRLRQAFSELERSGPGELGPAAT